MSVGLDLGLSKMSNKPGSFTDNFTSLQLQLKAMLEGAGGDDAVSFLDRLSELNPSEQKLALELFSSVIDKVKNGEERLFTAQDQALRDFEEDLYRDLLSSMREAANSPSAGPRIEVIHGGKTRRIRDKAPIDLAEARRNRKVRSKPVLN